MSERAQLSYSNVYLKNKIESATPIGRILIMCEACIRFLHKAEEIYNRGDDAFTRGGGKVEFTNTIIKAQNIIREFRNSLNLEIDETVALGFYKLYNYMLKQLFSAIRRKEVEPVQTVIGMMEKLYSSWKAAEEQGLGRDVKRAEDRKTKADGVLVRRVARASMNPVQPTRENLNFVM